MHKLLDREGDKEEKEDEMIAQPTNTSTKSSFTLSQPLSKYLLPCMYININRPFLCQYLACKQPNKSVHT